MTGFHQRAASARVRTAANTGTQKRKNKQYKVVLESVTQEKRKLHSINVSDARVPPGYTYIPVGHPEFSECCKELSRVKGLPVYVVSLRDFYVEPTHASYKRSDATAKRPVPIDSSRVAHHILRVGHHFSNTVVEAASVRLGFGPGETTDRRNYDHSGNSHLAKSLANHSRRLGLNYDHVTTGERSQQIRDTLKELFPKIPEADMERIIGRAFEEGTGRVGTAKELTLAHRVQAATAAHIRHQYTDYDYLLRIGSYHDARAAVSKACIDQVAKWRGEDEDDTAATELEDIFREIIVIDDEDEGEHGSVTSGALSDSDSSIEIVSRQTAVQDPQQDNFEDAEWVGSNTRTGLDEPAKRHMPRPRVGVAPRRGDVRAQDHRGWWQDAQLRLRADNMRQRPPPLYATSGAPHQPEMQQYANLQTLESSLIKDDIQRYRNTGRTSAPHLWSFSLVSPEKPTDTL
ncbi:hypothetical protein LTR60_001166 [Cryomyces antarcticus]|nr:hypothetical protein LTR60_001166 [Cryomyces antarcticus]